MVFEVNSYAAYDNKSHPKPYKLTRRDPLPDDVVIKIMYAGICHSDIHVAHNDWGNAKYPVVPGHEIIGTVEKVGDKVTKHKVGDIVAVGCMVDSCLNCEQCHEHHEVFCAKMAQTYNTPDERAGKPDVYTAGGYSEKIVVRDHFVVAVPKALQTPELLPGVAPILCAGITTFSPMMQHNLKKGQKCAIVGLGGLGSMGVKIAKALGADVTVLSRTHQKDAHAKELGADHVVASGSEEELKANASKFDLVIDTIPFDHDLNIYLPLVKPYGTMVVVGHLGEVEKRINTISLIFGNRKLAGSAIGGIKETEELLQLCAENQLVAMHKVIPMEDVGKAWDALDNGVSECRYIIDVTKFANSNAN